MGELLQQQPPLPMLVQPEHLDAPATIRPPSGGRLATTSHAPQLELPPTVVPQLSQPPGNPPQAVSPAPLQMVVQTLENDPASQGDSEGTAAAVASVAAAAAAASFASRVSEVHPVPDREPCVAEFIFWYTSFTVCL